MLRNVTAFLFVLSAVPVCLKAQDASVLGAGTRVRLITPKLDTALRVGTVISATRDTIVFKSDAFPAVRSVAVADIASIEISAGKQTHRGRDALYGLAIGSGTGALLGAASYKKPDPESCFIFCETRSGDAIAGGVLGGVVGTLVGAFWVGSLDKTERWVPLRKTATLFLSPVRGGARLAVAARF